MAPRTGELSARLGFMLRSRGKPGRGVWWGSRRPWKARFNASTIVGVIAGSLVLVPSLHAERTRALSDSSKSTARAPLVFGIYPGGAVGTVGPTGHVVPDNSSRQLAALRELRSDDHLFVLRLYASYAGPRTSSPAEQVGSAITAYTTAGFQIELVLTYRPTDQNPPEDIRGYTAFVRKAVEAFGPNPNVIALQVTNEVNITNAAKAADGYYAGAVGALVHGVIAAKERATAIQATQLEVGFNWAYSRNPGESQFWRALDRGGDAFRRSLDWVGLDVYPLTWGPRVGGNDLETETKDTMLDALSALRDHFMPVAQLSNAVAIHVSECGYPTGPERTYAMQSTVLKASVSVVNAERAAFNVTGFNWFDLRDAESSSANFESQYGLLHDDYTPKPAFDVYRHLVATLGLGDGVAN
jgi:hypothetical protein